MKYFALGILGTLNLADVNDYTATYLSVCVYACEIEREREKE